MTTKIRIRCNRCGHPEAIKGQAPGDQRPEYRCTRCDHVWTCGLNGDPREHEWAQKAAVNAVNKEK